MITFTISGYAADELHHKVSVTQDDHGDGIETCTSCAKEDLFPDGTCHSGRQAREVAEQLKVARLGGWKHPARTTLVLSLGAVLYCEEEMDNAAQICEDNALSFSEDAAPGRSYRRAQKRISQAIKGQVTA